MSKRDTPLVEADVIAILGVSAEEYRAALARGGLGRSIRLANDPTNRLAFHNFWDLVEFRLAGDADLGDAAGEERRRLAAELSDHLAEGAEDLAVGTGDEGADLAAVTREWADEAEADDLPAGVVRCYAGLLLRTLRVLYAAAVGMGGLVAPSDEGAGAVALAAEGFPTQLAA